MMPGGMDDEALMRGITGGESSRDAALRYIFSSSNWRAATIAWVQQYGGNEQDGEDVFMETIVYFDRNIRLGQFEGKSGLKTYFLAIAKRRWWKMLQKRRPEEEITALHYDEALPSVEELTIAAEQRVYLDKMLAQMSERCQKMLKLYKLSYSMAEIAADMGLSSAEMAKKEVYRCRQRALRFLGDNPEWEDLIK